VAARRTETPDPGLRRLRPCQECGRIAPRGVHARLGEPSSPRWLPAASWSGRRACGLAGCRAVTLHTESAAGCRRKDIPAAKPNQTNEIQPLGKMSKKRKPEEIEEIPKPLSQSNFKRCYRRSTAPLSINEFKAALHDFVRAYLKANRHKGSDSEDRLLFECRIKSEIVSEHKKSRAKGEDRQTALNRAAQKMWTSDRCFRMASKKHKLFSMMNEAIRMDHMDLMAPLAILSRAINKLCLYKSDVFPRKGLCFRGSGMMPWHRDFFVEDKTYRVPSFLATSFSNVIANDFMKRAEARGQEPVLWTVRLDGRGATDPDHRCLHVNLLEAQEFEEQEFLFVPYSTFTVEAVLWSRRPTLATPHRITIFAANDNRAEPEDLPVAPWF
jgi:hypothetical protein